MLVGDFLSISTARFADKTAVVCGERRMSYRELDDASDRLAAVLSDAGVVPGDRVVIVLENSAEAAVAVFGTLKAGAAFVVINHTIRSDKLGFILEDCTPRALLLEARHTSSHLDAAGRVESIRCVVVSGDVVTGAVGTASVVRFDDILASQPGSPPRGRTIDVDLAALIYTSGSTGSAKGVAVSHLNIVSAATSITGYLRNTADDVILNALPLSFDYGLYQLLMSVKVGATLVLEKSFAYPFRMVERIQQEKVTGLPCVPTIFALLLQLDGIEPERFDSVRYVTNTAEALSPSWIPRLRQMFRKAQIYSMYGLTECKRVSYLDPAELDRRPGSVGRAMPNVRVLVVDDNGEPVPPGVVGELTVRGSNVMLGYWNHPDATSAVIRPGAAPWQRVLYTGDLFKQDDEGFLYFVSRKDDIIKSRGQKVSPIEVERVILEMDGIVDVVVVAGSDPVLGQSVKAVVVLSAGSGLTGNDVIRHCSARLENFMVPRQVEFVDSLPRTASGKLRRTLCGDSNGRPANGDS